VDDDELLLNLGQILDDPLQVDPFPAADFNDDHVYSSAPKSEIIESLLQFVCHSREGGNPVGVGFSGLPPEFIRLGGRE
jgi:hypothetical protein